jgi:hypothetical protein
MDAQVSLSLLVIHIRLFTEHGAKLVHRTMCAASPDTLRSNAASTELICSHKFWDKKDNVRFELCNIGTNKHVKFLLGNKKYQAHGPNESWPGTKLSAHSRSKLSYKCYGTGRSSATLVLVTNPYLHVVNGNKQKVMLQLKLIHTRLCTVQGLADNPQVISTMRFVRLWKSY